MEQTYFDLFAFERMVVTPKGDRYFENCMLLKDMDGFKKGHWFESINGEVTLRCWTSEANDEQIEIKL